MKFAIEIDLNAHGAVKYGVGMIYHKIVVDSPMFAFADILASVIRKYGCGSIHCVNVYNISGKKFIGRVFYNGIVERPIAPSANYTIYKFDLDHATFLTLARV